MRMVILGAGKVGATLAEHLTREQHDIVVVDHEPKRLKLLEDRLDIRTYTGHASYPGVLRAAGAKGADMVIAVTDIDEVNMIACQVAHSLFKTPLKIARVRSQHYFVQKELFGDENLPVDVFISPELLVIDYIKALIHHPGASKVIDFKQGQVKLVGLKPFYGGQLLGKALNKIPEILPNVDLKIVGIYRDGKSVSLTGKTEIQIEDQIYFLTTDRYAQTVVGALRPQIKQNQRIMIAGGGHIGGGLAARLERDYQVKIIDISQAQCQYMSERLNSTTILLGDATDEKLLMSENIEDMDVFCALTDSDEVNVIACLQAKRLGVRQTIALMTKPSYGELVQDKDINIVISPQQATASSVLSYIRGGNIVSAHAFRKGRAEIMEIKIMAGQKNAASLIGKMLKSIRLPKDAMIGMIIRKDEVMVPEGETMIEEGDHLIIFVPNQKSVKKVERIFCDN